MAWWAIKEELTGELLKPEGRNIRDKTAPVLVFPHQIDATRYRDDLKHVMKLIGVEIELTVMPLPMAALHYDDIPQP